MKKIIAVVAALAMMLALAACGETPAPTSSKPTSEPASVTSEESVVSEVSEVSEETSEVSEETSEVSEETSEPTVVDETGNLALIGTPDNDSDSTEYPQYVSALMVDGDHTSESRWQSAHAGNETDPAYCGIK